MFLNSAFCKKAKQLLVGVGLLLSLGFLVDAASYFSQSFFSVPVVYADLASDIQGNLNTAGDTGVGGNKNVIQIIGAVVQAVLGLLGVIFMILIVYAGFRWMMARGVAGEVTKAVDTLREAVVGLVIVLTAAALTYFVMRAINTAVGTNF